MAYWVMVFVEFSILISVVISFRKLRSVRKEFMPFVISLWVNLLGCIAAEVAIYFWGSNAVVSNLYVILFSILVIWQFKRWGLFSVRPAVFYLLVSFFIILWPVDNLVLGNLYSFNPYARILTSVVIVLLSIYLLSDELVAPSESFWKSSKRLILVAHILLFTVKIITEFFWQYGIQLGDLLANYLYTSFQIVDFVTNFLYTLAIIWIPVTTRFSGLSR